MRCDSLTRNFRSKGLRAAVADFIKSELSLQVVDTTLSKIFRLPTCIISTQAKGLLKYNKQLSQKWEIKLKNHLPSICMRVYIYISVCVCVCVRV